LCQASNLDAPNRHPLDWEPDSKVERNGSAPRQILDVILQSCTVELFHALGVAVAPVARSWTSAAPREHFNSVGAATFTDPKANGTLVLSLDDGVYALFPQPAVGPAAKDDLLRELTNQLAGRIKNRLLQFQVTLRIGLPSVLRKQTLDRQFASTTPFAAYVFRTLRGEIVMTMNGTIDPGALNYATRVEVAKEGDFIEF
jgi:hypothetical protein